MKQDPPYLGGQKLPHFAGEPSYLTGQPKRVHASVGVHPRRNTLGRVFTTLGGVHHRAHK